MQNHLFDLGMLVQNKNLLSCILAAAMVYEE